MTPGRIDIITMGCSKNLVDSEQLMCRLAARGYEMHHDSHDVCGQVVVVNTCGFIGDAKQESIEMILSLVQAKEEGKIGKLYVMGCLSERYLKELEAEIEGVDGWYGKFDWQKLVDSLPLLAADYKSPELWERTLTTSASMAYLKISEGCNRMCAYCAIPLITGRHRSRSVDSLLNEVKSLVAKGVKEFNVIAQDLSAYGTDFPDGQSHLAELIDRMAEIQGVEWIRLHYAYPVNFPWEVLEVMRRRSNVCNYLDIALQHISTPVLANMRRHIDKQQTLDLIQRIREEVPGIRLRTTLMTGFPGEGEDEFAELVQFVKDAKFDRLGVFAYSEEEGTWAARHLEDTIPQDVKESRREQLLDLHEGISQSLNDNFIGKRLRVIVDSLEVDGDDEILICRTEYDSPEVDHVVNVELPHGMKVPTPGEFINVEITDSMPYDLYGKIV